MSRNERRRRLEGASNPPRDAPAKVTMIDNDRCIEGIARFKPNRGMLEAAVVVVVSRGRVEGDGFEGRSGGSESASGGGDSRNEEETRMHVASLRDRRYSLKSAARQPSRG